MAAVDGDVAAVCCGDMVIVDRFDIKYLRKGCFKKLKYSVFLLVRALSLSKGDRNCKDLAMAKKLKISHFSITPSVREENC